MLDYAYGTAYDEREKYFACDLHKREARKVYFAVFDSHSTDGTVLWSEENRDKNGIVDFFKKHKCALRLLKYGNRKIII